MKPHTQVLRGALVVAALALAGDTAFALPTMIRLGYHECASCHISPQGGGPLTEYGRGIDEAQSRRAGEYRQTDNRLAARLAWGGRITQDVRLVAQGQAVWASGQTGSTSVWPRLIYRNVTDVGRGLSLAAVVTGQTPTAPYRAPEQPAARLFVNTALLHYRPAQAIAIAAGRDQLPSGINVPDFGVFFKSRNRAGYEDAPSQLKAFLGGRRWTAAPYVFAPGGHEPAQAQESGFGALTEIDLFGRGTSVAGITLQRGRTASDRRHLTGAYVRLGFGQWGILAEHDVTSRTRGGAASSSREHSTYAQVFLAVREWLVLSGVAEHFRSGGPGQSRLTAGKFELAARLTNQASVSFGARVHHDVRSGWVAGSAAVQLALKSAQ